MVINNVVRTDDVINMDGENLRRMYDSHGYGRKMAFLCEHVFEGSFVPNEAHIWYV